jgi:hypothetical protein
MDRIGGSASETAKKSPPLIDPVQLNRRTHGNASLQVEVLALFVNEVERLMRQIDQAANPQLRGDRLRGLSALARNTGAALVAHEARAAETKIGEDDPDLSALRNAVSETLALIRRNGF